jgi:hypothetical protein
LNGRNRNKTPSPVTWNGRKRKQQTNRKLGGSGLFSSQLVLSFFFFFLFFLACRYTSPLSALGLSTRDTLHVRDRDPVASAAAAAAAAAVGAVGAVGAASWAARGIGYGSDNVVSYVFI